MALRLIEIISDSTSATAASALAKQYEAVSVHGGPVNEQGRRRTTVLIGRDRQQDYLDALQGAFPKDGDWRIVLMPVEAAIPDPEKERAEKDKAAKEIAEKTGLELDPEAEKEKKAKARKAMLATREELYNEVTKGAKLDQNFLLLVVLSGIVAAIGLIGDNVAVVIGAMVIAPLLGPNLALAVGSALGDKELMWQAIKTNAAGLGLTLAMTVIIGLIWGTGALDSPELLSRTEVNLSAVVLALASGTAGVLSLTSGLSSTLVGVMVAVALMPPAAVVGITLGAGRIDLAIGATMLLAINIASVNLSAQLVLLAKGIRPRTWLEQYQAKQSVKRTILVWGVMLAVLVAIIILLQIFE